MTAQNSWLFSDGYAVLRAAWTAMDQTYGTTTSNMPLEWTDDAADEANPARNSAWAVPPGWTISASIDSPLSRALPGSDGSGTEGILRAQDYPIQRRRRSRFSYDPRNAVDKCSHER